jgi:plasmid stabilization system protein ParE
MAYKVRLTKLAEADAHLAYDRVRASAPARADAWLTALFSAVMTLDELLVRCPLITETGELDYQARQLLYGKRTSAYRINFDIQELSEEGLRVRVLRIWHGSRSALTPEDIEFDLTS